MTSILDKISASDIVFPDCEPAEPPSVVEKFDLDAVVHHIWRTLGARGTSNRNDQLHIAIKALIAAASIPSLALLVRQCASVSQMPTLAPFFAAAAARGVVALTAFID